MVSKLTNPEVLQFIQEHLKEDPAKLMLQKRKHNGLPVKEIADQIAARHKGRKKLPEWYAHNEIIFPKRQNLEQASSEKTAKFKARGLSGKTFADLTGGSGIDLFYMGQNFEKLIYVDPNEELGEIADHNFRVLGRTLEIHTQKAEKFLKATERSVFDVIYLDPSRRDHINRKVFSLEDYQPNVVDMYDQLLESANLVIVKTSPMVDIQKTRLVLPDTCRIQVIAVENEVKEVLFHLKKGCSDEAYIEAVNIKKNGDEDRLSFTRSEEKEAVASISKVKRYLFDPNSALRKAGAFKLIATKLGLGKIAHHTHLYTSDEIEDDFPGRIFEVIETLKPSKKEIRKRFPNGKVNVIAKNYPIKPNELKKKFLLKDGGGEFLIFCQTEDSGNSVFRCRKVDRL